MIRLDRLDNWYKLIIILDNYQFIDGDSAIPTSVPLD